LQIRESKTWQNPDSSAFAASHDFKISVTQKNKRLLTGCDSGTGSVMHSGAPFTVIRALSDFLMTFSKTQLPQGCLKMDF